MSIYKEKDVYCCTPPAAEGGFLLIPTAMCYTYLIASTARFTQNYTSLPDNTIRSNQFVSIIVQYYGFLTYKTKQKLMLEKTKV